MKPPFIAILKVLLPIVIIGVAVMGMLTMIWTRPPVETLTPVIPRPGVRVHEVALQDAPLTVTSQGTVQPRTESQLVPEIAGRVTWVAPSFAEGGFFEAGDVLVRIDPFDYEQQLVSARSQLAQARLRLAEEEAEAEVARREWETLGRGDPRELALRKPQLEDARASVAAAEAGVERAVRDLERADILAPYAGRVRSKDVDIGQYVRVGDTIATVYAVDVAEIRLPLPDDELAYLDVPLSYRGVEQRAQPGVTLRATFAGQTHAWEGRIVRTESEIDPVSRMVHAIAEVADPYAAGPNPDRPPLAVGMYVEAEIGGRTARDVAVLPREALRGRDQVLVVEPDDRLSFRTVDVLRTSTESVIVQAGLQAGDLVVTSALDTPTDGMVVQIADADPELLARRGGGSFTPPEASRPVAPAGEADQFFAPGPDSGLADGAAPAAFAARDLPPAESPAPAAAEPDSGLAASEPGGQVADSGAPPADSGPGFASEAAPVDAAGGPAGEVAEVGSPAPAPAGAEAGAGDQLGEPPTADAVEAGAGDEPGEPPTADAALRAVRESDATERPAWLQALLRETSRAPAGGRMTRAETEATARARSGGGRETARAADPEAVSADPAATETARGAAAEPAATPEPAADAGTEAAAGGGTPDAGLNALSVMPFDDLSAGNASALAIDLGAAITEAVTERVAALRSVGVVAAGDGAAWVIGGGIQRMGSLIRVTARLTEVRSGAVVSAVKIDGTVEALADLRERVADAMEQTVRDALAREPGGAAGRGADAAAPRREGRQA